MQPDRNSDGRMSGNETRLARVHDREEFGPGALKLKAPSSFSLSLSPQPNRGVGSESTHVGVAVAAQKQNFLEVPFTYNFNIFTLPAPLTPFQRGVEIRKCL